jgi:topoisomerase-4 subunit A
MGGSDPVTNGNGGNGAQEVQLADILQERYLAYALSTIMSRSLPDVRDGLKPVHRRLLYTMRELKLNPTSAFRKCAKIVGDTMGNYHPHGDSAIYDAMVRLAQSFAVRYPLVDGQGNFGNIDGDSAAAYRYTEARLTAIAEALLEGIDEDSVDFRENYSGESEEPVVLPAGFPNLLANGAQGIAVGMATNIPPHNINEICDALLHLTKTIEKSIARNPGDLLVSERVSGVTFEKLLSLMPGPDFPTGGELVESRESILEAYRTGRGSLRLRARWEVENLKNGTWQIIVTEIPYQVQKNKLEERIADLLTNRKLPMLADVRDESADDIRLVLEPKSRNVDPATLMESLYRHTDLEVRFGMNMNVLDADQTPRVMNLREVLQAFLEHRHVVLQRRTEFRLGKIAQRLELLDGFLIAYLNIDEVIRIVREEDEPKQELMSRFKLSDNQAEAILNLRLRRLHKLQEMEIRTEHKNLTEEQAALQALMGDEEARWGKVASEIRDMRAKFGKDPVHGPRRTVIGEPPSAVVVPLEAMIEREPSTIVCSKRGWVRALRGHLPAETDLKYKEGDEGRFFLHAETTDKLLVFATNGRFYTLGVDKLPGGRGFGEPLNLMIDLGSEEIVSIMVHKPGRKLLVAASDGRGFVVEEDGVLAQTRAGKQVLNVSDKAPAMLCITAEGDSVAVIGRNRKLLVFGLDEIPTMTRGRGVILQRYKDGGLSDVKTFVREEGLAWKHGGGERTETKLEGWLGKRAQAGRLPPTGFPRSNKFS